MIPSARSGRGCAFSIDQDRLEFFGVEQRDVYDTIQTLFGGVPVGYSHRGEDRNPIEIAVKLPKRDLAWTEALASTPVPANTLPGSKTRCRTRTGRQGRDRRRLARSSSAATAASPIW